MAGMIDAEVLMILLVALAAAELPDDAREKAWEWLNTHKIVFPLVDV